MNIIEVNDYEEMSITAAKTIIEKVRTNPRAVLGLASGDTPKGTYQYLIYDHVTNGTSYRYVTTFNLDEYMQLHEDDTHSYRYFMDHQLLNHIDIPKSQTYLPNGISKDLEKECENYEALILEKGGINLQLLGLGSNGHIGFNEPGTPFHSKTHVVNLTSSTREANARFFESIEKVPIQAISMGIQTIMQSK